MTTTEKGNLAKEKLIRTAAELFVEKGFYNTGINEILERSGLSKGSFYFYFNSKNELAAAVAAFYGRLLVEEWLSKLPKENWESFVESLTSDLRRFSEEGSYFGCPVMVLGSEVAFTEPELSGLYADGMRRMMNVYAEVLRNTGYQGEEAERLARKAFALSEGYMLLFRIGKEKSVFQSMRDDLLEICQNSHKNGSKG